MENKLNDEDVKTLQQCLNYIHTQPKDALSKFVNLFQPGTLKKGEYFVEEGLHSSKVALILEGVMRTFYRTSDGVEYNKTFFMENSFVTSLASVLQRTESHLNFQALTDCRILTCDFYEIEKLYVKYRSVETLVRLVLQNDWVIKKEQRELRLVLNSAEERYLYFQEEYLGLENRIPQYHIASHLGITPIQLSRIRANLSKNK